MSKTFNFGSSVLSGGVEGFMVTMLQNIGGIASEKGADYLKSRMFGFGTNDEKLFLSACTHALKKDMITKENLLRFLRLISSKSDAKQKRIVLIVGGEEQEVTDTVTGKDEKGKKVTKRVSYKANLAGAEVIAMFGKMTNEEIDEVLEASGASKVFMEEFKNKARNYISNSAKSFTDDFNEVFAKETWLDRKAREIRERKEKGGLK